MPRYYATFEKECIILNVLDIPLSNPKIKVKICIRDICTCAILMIIIFNVKRSKYNKYWSSGKKNNIY